MIMQIAAYDEAGTPLEREAFMKELEHFYRSRSLEFKPPKFYQVPLNCLKYVLYNIPSNPFSHKYFQMVKCV